MSRAGRYAPPTTKVTVRFTEPELRQLDRLVEAALRAKEEMWLPVRKRPDRSSVLRDLVKRTELALAGITSDKTPGEYVGQVAGDTSDKMPASRSSSRGGRS